MEFICEETVISWSPQRLVIAGYTGKDQEAVKKHIEELKELGVPAPPQVPMLYDLSPELLLTSNEITVVQNDSSGEAEVVLLHINGSWYAGLGSDHTDRILEAVSIQKSKQVCAKTVTKELWLLDSFINRWDEIEIKSWVQINGSEQLYQSGRLGEFLHPEQLMRIVEERGYAGSDMALYCGTLPLHGGFVFGGVFRAELVDRKTGRKLELKYQMKLLKNAEEE
ncbi:MULTISPECIES: DUF2848 family protein [Paenibacillus]|uniref:DUF2848 domain-containing protein n=2 Tax=Paenibacillus TaxID=44249 RepID=A0A1H8PFQ8_9BACL|nr:MULTISPECIES: DUF2848 family protein [Paenibacillus]QWU16562.1 DUF2848 domain-containing protein [Paenibacillus sophorae]RQW11233.1 DUF2848 domain-containing protein [Paenibacillus rhizophilus]SEO40802.1 Protein of unknown function [Paenibacillus sophorae]